MKSHIVINAEKYRTPQEQETAFREYCRRKSRGIAGCVGCCVCGECKGNGEPGKATFAAAFAWLAKEAEEDPALPCPCCGTQAVHIKYGKKRYWVECPTCHYRSSDNVLKCDAVATHNKMAEAMGRK